MRFVNAWAKFVTERWLLVIVAWILVVAGVRWFAPAWDSVTEDGDFQYLPDRCSSVSGQRLLDTRFAAVSSRSHMVAVVARDQPLGTDFDLAVASDAARRIELLAGESCLVRAKQLPEGSKERIKLAEQAIEHFVVALDFTQSLLKRPPEGAITEPPWFDDGPYSPMAIALQGKQWGLEIAGRPEEASEAADTALSLDPNIESRLFPERSNALTTPIEKVWTWKTEGIGSALMHLRGNEAVARLVVMHLDTEFLAVENLAAFERVQAELAEVRAWTLALSSDPPKIGISGSAAVGSDLLEASAEAVSNTEWATILFVFVILGVVYRAPLMIMIPMITIGVSLSVAIGLLAAATQVDTWFAWSWWTFGVFKTTRIFVVVILFGAGTDFCLFLISRLRENISAGANSTSAVAESLVQVAPALVASALTTILGLGMMAFAEFGKLAHSGPAIGLALAVTLLACLSLTPALLAAFGSKLFWPTQFVLPEQISALGTESSQAAAPSLWDRLAEIVVRYPGRVMVASLLVLAPIAWHGWQQQSHVTYDLLAGLDEGRPSRQGTDLLREHYPVGESGPIVVLATLPDSPVEWTKEGPTPELLEATGKLAIELEAIDGVDYARSIEAPLGHRGRSGGPTQQVVRALPQVRALFFSLPNQSSVRATNTTQPVSIENPSSGVLRLDLVLKEDVFSIAATQTVDRVLAHTRRLKETPNSIWSQAQFSVAGTTAAVRDLREVTISDSQRVELLVVIAVYVVLVLILKHPLTCAYMILSVVFSYLVTVGLSDWVFEWSYGENYHGLEWKVPLFLFVILVAVGEDYNVYLASRVFEEQARIGQFAGLRRAIGKTGGIISSCGAIMAGTFIAMTSPVWHFAIPSSFSALKTWAEPEGGSLQGMIQMGFALTIGVLLDTFVVRPILLPAYLAIVARIRTGRTDDLPQSLSS